MQFNWTVLYFAFNKPGTNKQDSPQHDDSSDYKMKPRLDKSRKSSDQGEPKSSRLEEYAKFESLMYNMDAQFNSILHLGAHKNSVKILHLILDMMLENRFLFGDLLRKRNFNGETFFQVACNQDCFEIVDRMLKQKQMFSVTLNYYLLNDYDNNLNTVLFSSILNNRLRCVRLLLAHGANPNALNKYRQNGLHLSCCIGSYESTEVLMKYGCDYFCLDAYKMNSMNYACQSGSQDIVKLLLNLKDTYMLVNNNCLNNAIEYNHPCVVDILLKSKYWHMLIKLETSIIRNLIEKMVSHLNNDTVQRY